MPGPAALREAVSDLVTLADADLTQLWREVSSALQAREALLDLLPVLVDAYGSAAATVAADWYDDLRDAERIAGRFTAIPAELDDTGADALARWGVDPLFHGEPDWSRAQALISGGLQKRIANAARNTVTGSAVQDPAADGWQRVARGSGCPFCQMLAGRGAVYRESTVDFSPHDDCHCVATVAWTDREKPVKPYTPTDRNITDADRARVREWIAANL